LGLLFLYNQYWKRKKQREFGDLELVKKLSPETTIETLIPDVKGNWDALARMIEARQEVVSHNMETVGDV
jgi:lipoate synthase